MKIIGLCACYVELEDIEFIGELPINAESVMWPKQFHSKNFKFIRFYNKDTREFLEEQKGILDYKCVKEMSVEELESKINELESKINEYLSKSSSIGEKGEDNVHDFDIESEKHILESLKKYKNNKQLYDSEISEFNFRVKLNYMPSIEHFEPVRTVPVDPVHMEMLNMGIREKVKQNRLEQTASKEGAKNYFVRG